MAAAQEAKVGTSGMSSCVRVSVCVCAAHVHIILLVHCNSLTGSDSLSGIVSLALQRSSNPKMPHFDNDFMLISVL